MINPLIDNLDNLSDVEVENKVFDLQKKYFQTRNPDVQRQLVNLLEIYKEEMRTRRAIQAQRQKEQQNGENDLDNLINIS